MFYALVFVHNRILCLYCFYIVYRIFRNRGYVSIRLYNKCHIINERIHLPDRSNSQATPYRNPIAHNPAAIIQQAMIIIIVTLMLVLAHQE